MEREPAHILIVEDNNMNRLTLYRGVQRLGHTAEVAANGQEALDKLQSQAFDAVLLDIMMPVMGGFEVLERMKDDPALREIPVIVISAEDDMDTVARAIECGAEDLLPKPFNPLVLRARLNASLEKKRLRDLGRAYLQQEMMLRQSEKLATLGKLSAGMAHELNNPAAAAQRGAGQIYGLLDRLQEARVGLGPLALTDAQITMMRALDQLARERAGSDGPLDPMLISDREQEIERFLERQGIDRAWDYAPDLAAAGITLEDLAPIIEGFPPQYHDHVIAWLNGTVSLYGVLDDVRQALGQVSRIVGALKAYSYMDQAPVQLIDIPEAIENTLVILRTKIGDGIDIRTEYAPGLPRIEGYGSELNQVWTNLVDNAVAALNGNGEILIRAYPDGDWAVLEFQDTGDGIPEDIQSRIFDPFFTTRPPGQGAGLGLTISHNIIVQKHSGQISVSSRPGATCFQVRLPVNLSS